MEPKRYYSAELVTGVINSDTLGTGITSTEGEEKTLIKLHLTASAKQDNVVRLWYEREKIFEMLIQQVPLRTYPILLCVPINFKIPVGKSIKASISCGGTANDIDVGYQWSLTEEVS